MTTLFSVIGGIAGYALGYFAFDLITPWLESGAFWEHYEAAAVWFDKWGVAVVFISGFSPIPYKIFTVSAGVLEQNLAGFIIASLAGRGARFFLVAWLIKWAGPKVLPVLKRRINTYGWTALAVLVALVLLYYLM